MAVDRDARRDINQTSCCRPTSAIGGSDFVLWQFWHLGMFFMMNLLRATVWKSTSTPSSRRSQGATSRRWRRHVFMMNLLLATVPGTYSEERAADS